jgi:hypothetical protein
VRDLEERAYREACAAFASQQSALRRYADIVAMQNQAAAANDMDRVAELAGRVDLIIAELAESGHRLEPTRERLRSKALTGPRADAARRLMRAVANAAAATEADVRGLTQELVRHRDAVGRDLAALDAAAAMNAQYAVAVGAAPRFSLDLVG